MNNAIGVKIKGTKEMEYRHNRRVLAGESKALLRILYCENQPAGNTVLWQHADPGVMWWADCFRASILPIKISACKIDLVERIHRKRRDHMRQACSYMLIDWNIEIIHNVHLDLIGIRRKSC